MRLSIPFFLLLLLANSLLFTACKSDAASQGDAASPPKPIVIDDKPVSAEGAQPFEVVEGQVFWQAKKAMGGGHNGTLQVKTGELLVNEGRLLRGNVRVDMNTIAVSDIKDAGERADLESHLRDADFFNVAQFPEAVFEIDEVSPSALPDFNWVVSGKLTLHGKTNPINIPARIQAGADELRIESPAFIINRTQWGVNFRSGLLGTAKDKLIDDGLVLSVKATARRKGSK